jgi:hypothetical protein
MKTTLTIFRELPVGARFHTGKSRGTGARSHVLNCEVIEKTDRTRGRVVQVVGDWNTPVGAGRTFHWMSRVWPVGAGEIIS